MVFAKNSGGYGSDCEGVGSQRSWSQVHGIFSNFIRRGHETTPLARGRFHERPVYLLWHTGSGWKRKR